MANGEIISRWLDSAGKLLSRMRTVGVLVLVLLFMLSMARQGCQEAELEDMQERITVLKAKNDSLRHDTHTEWSQIVENKDEVIEMQQQHIKKDNCRDRIWQIFAVAIITALLAVAAIS